MSYNWELRLMILVIALSYAVGILVGLGIAADRSTRQTELIRIECPPQPLCASGVACQDPTYEALFSP